MGFGSAEVYTPSPGRLASEMETRIMRTSATYPLALCALLALAAPATVLADPAALQALSSQEAAGGLRAALSKGIGTAVTQLGAKNGFLNDPKVAIPLPANLD